jgi:hypothetical protein
MLPTASYAHLMAAQQGTLNIIDNHVFVVLSIPITAFEDIDNNTHISIDEFNQHRKKMAVLIKTEIMLIDENTHYEIDGLLLSPDTPHDKGATVIENITIMGRYTPSNISNNVKFSVGLFGKYSHEQTYKITTTNSKKNLKHSFEITTKNPTQLILK